MNTDTFAIHFIFKSSFKVLVKVDQLKDLMSLDSQKLSDFHKNTGMYFDKMWVWIKYCNNKEACKVYGSTVVNRNTLWLTSHITSAHLCPLSGRWTGQNRAEILYTSLPSSWTETFTMIKTLWDIRASQQTDWAAPPGSSHLNSAPPTEQVEPLQQGGAWGLHTGTDKSWAKATTRLWSR